MAVRTAPEQLAAESHQAEQHRVAALRAARRILAARAAFRRR